MNSGAFSFSFDKAFEDVIQACAGPRGEYDGTWLVPEMIEAYINLHRLGLAHSVEAWQGGELAGGLYGVALGGAFFGESMFYRKANASKAACVHLMGGLAAAGFPLVDCQQVTGNMLRFGARPVPRAEFMRRLGQALELPLKKGDWREGIPCLGDAA
jgi:leucyl/phenylalanyl-tRNA--protein transferase